MKLDIFYPGWCRKAISFTIDDGNIEMDTKFISIVKPFGIRGTFNLCSPDLKRYTPDFYREMYDGFGIANHCKLHPFLLNGTEGEITDEPFDVGCADESKLYKTEREGVYNHHTPNGWRRKATLKTYCELITECHEELESIFGEGSVRSFVWPFGDQRSDDILKYIEDKHGYFAARRTGNVEDTTGFAVPSDRMHWSYNASHKNLLDCAAKYEAYGDDSELKFFSFGVHSIDYERAECWHELEEFAEKYGNRPSDFYYAPIDDIFRYCDATKELRIDGNEIENPTDVEIYVKIDGTPAVLKPKSKI